MIRLALAGLFLISSVVNSTVQAEEQSFSTVTRMHQGTFSKTPLTFKSVIEGFKIKPLGSGDMEVVSTSYISEPEQAQRPVLFAFNGGPISPSVYLHMLALGPRRLAIDDDLSASPNDFPVVNNTYSPLDKTDLVFFDPAGTGFSRFAESTTPETYYGNTSDAAEFVAFMNAWLARHHREDSPVYIVGESYGTMRLAAVAKQLSENQSEVNLRGIYLFGQALNLIETAQRTDNMLTYAVSLPTLAALGWYHQQLDSEKQNDFDALMKNVNDFAYGDYLQVLLKGNTATANEKKAVAKRLEALTGLSASVYLEHDLRIKKNQFRANLLKEQGLVLGASDGRYLKAPTKDAPLPDGVDVIYPATYAAFNNMAKQYLGVSNDREYVVTSPIKGLSGWNWGSKAGPFANFPYADGITAAMQYYPKLNVMVGAGHYDTLTTTGATDYLLRQVNWPQNRVMKREYFGGHMSYTVEDNLAMFTKDIKALIAQ